MADILQEDIAVKRYIVYLPFSVSNVPDAAGTAKVNADGNEYRMTRSGSVVGISAQLNAALSGGTVTFRPTVDGTAKTALSTDVSSSAQGSQKTKAANTVPFAAGAKLGVDYVKSGTVNPTTTDAIIVLEVLLDGVEL